MDTISQLSAENPLAAAVWRLEQRLDGERRNTQRQVQRLEKRIEDTVQMPIAAGRWAELEGHVDGLAETLHSLVRRAEDNSGLCAPVRKSFGGGMGETVPIGTSSLGLANTEVDRLLAPVQERQTSRLLQVEQMLGSYQERMLDMERRLEEEVRCDKVGSLIMRLEFLEGNATLRGSSVASSGAMPFGSPTRTLGNAPAVLLDRAPVLLDSSPTSQSSRTLASSEAKGDKSLVQQLSKQLEQLSKQLRTISESMVGLNSRVQETERAQTYFLDFDKHLAHLEARLNRLEPDPSNPFLDTHERNHRRLQEVPHGHWHLDCDRADTQSDAFSFVGAGSPQQDVVSSLVSRVEELERGLQDVSSTQDLRQEVSGVGEQVLRLLVRLQNVEQGVQAASEWHSVCNEMDRIATESVVSQSRVRELECAVERLTDGFSDVCGEVASLRDQVNSNSSPLGVDLPHFDRLSEQVDEIRHCIFGVSEELSESEKDESLAVAPQGLLNRFDQASRQITSLQEAANEVAEQLQNYQLEGVSRSLRETKFELEGIGWVRDLRSQLEQAHRKHEQSQSKMEAEFRSGVTELRAEFIELQEQNASMGHQQLKAVQPIDPPLAKSVALADLHVQVEHLKEYLKTTIEGWTGEWHEPLSLMWERYQSQEAELERPTEKDNIASFKEAVAAMQQQLMSIESQTRQNCASYSELSAQSLEFKEKLDVACDERNRLCLMPKADVEHQMAALRDEFANKQNSCAVDISRLRDDLLATSCNNAQLDERLHEQRLLIDSMPDQLRGRFPEVEDRVCKLERHLQHILRTLDLKEIKDHLEVIGDGHAKAVREAQVSQVKELTRLQEQTSSLFEQQQEELRRVREQLASIEGELDTLRSRQLQEQASLLQESQSDAIRSLREEVPRKYSLPPPPVSLACAEHATLKEAVSKDNQYQIEQRSEIKLLQERLDSLQDEHARMRHAEASAYSEKLAQVNEIKQLFNEEVSQMRLHLSEEVRRIQEQIRSEHENIESSQANQRTMEGVTPPLLQEELRRMQERLDSLQDEHAQMRHAEASARSEKLDRVIEIKQLHEEVCQVRLHLAEEIMRLQTQIHSEHASIESNQANQRTTEEVAASLLQRKLSEDLRRMQERVDILQDEHAQMRQAEVSASSEKLSQVSEIKQLHEEVCSMRVHLAEEILRLQAQIHSEHESIETRHANQMTTYDRQCEEIRLVRSKQDSIGDGHVELRTMIDENRQQLAALRDEHSPMRDAKLSQANEIKQLHEEVCSVRVHLAEEIMRLQAQIHSEHESIESRHANQITTYDSQCEEIRLLRSQQTSIGAEHEELRTMIDENRQQLAALRDEHSPMRDAKLSQANEIKQLHEEVCSVRVHLAEEIMLLQAQIHSEHESIESRHANQITTYDSQCEEIRLLRSQQTSIGAEHEELQTMVKQYQQLHARHMKSLQELHEQISSTQEHILEEVSQLRRSIGEESTRCAVNSEDQQELPQELANVTARIKVAQEQMEMRITELQDAVKHLQKKQESTDSPDVRKLSSLGDESQYDEINQLRSRSHDVQHDEKKNKMVQLQEQTVSFCEDQKEEMRNLRSQINLLCDEHLETSRSEIRQWQELSSALHEECTELKREQRGFQSGALQQLQSQFDKFFELCKNPALENSLAHEKQKIEELLLKDAQSADAVVRDLATKQERVEESENRIELDSRRSMDLAQLAREFRRRTSLDGYRAEALEAVDCRVTAVSERLEDVCERLQEVEQDLEASGHNSSSLQVRFEKLEDSIKYRVRTVSENLAEIATRQLATERGLLAAVAHGSVSGAGLRAREEIKTALAEMPTLVYTACEVDQDRVGILPTYSVDDSTQLCSSSGIAEEVEPCSQ